LAGQVLPPRKIESFFLRIKEQHRGRLCRHGFYTGVQNGLDNFTEVYTLSYFRTHGEVSIEVRDLLVVRQPVKELLYEIGQQAGNLLQENSPGRLFRRRQH